MLTDEGLSLTNPPTLDAMPGYDEETLAE